MKKEHIPPCRLACIRRTGAYGRANRETMERLKLWAESEGLLNGDSVILGIARDNPEQTKPEDCRYDACLVVSEEYAPDAEAVQPGEIPGGLYAVFLVEHTAKALERVWKEIFPELSKRGLEPDGSRPVLERYRQKLVDRHLCEICVPLL